MDTFLTIELPYLIRGAQVTLMLGLSCIFFSTLLGLFLGIASSIAPPVARYAITAYVYVIRGIPLLVALFIVYFGLPFFGFVLNPNLVAIIAISAYIGALNAEIVRGAINSVPRGQVEAGRALGYEDLFIMTEIVLPQAVRYALPPYVSLLPVTVKATALAAVISVWELTLASKEIVTRTLDAFPIFAASMIIYFVLTFPLTRLSTYIEGRMAKIAW
jgi:polar amino acid transport system permease protein